MSIYQKREKERRYLADGLEAMGASLNPEQINQLLDYLDLFEKWNRSYNLSAVRDRRSMLSLHLLDSLSLLPHLEGQSFADVGTGGGLPGIPLAIAFPEKHFTLIDSAGKKMRFLHQVKSELALTNVGTFHGRAEDFQGSTFDGVISRAFASLKDMVHFSAGLLSPGGRFWAMKGQKPEEELREIEKDFIVDKLTSLHVPDLDAHRCLVVFHPKEPAHRAAE